MTEPMHSALVTESTKKAKDGNTRKLLLLLAVLWLAFVTYLILDYRADAVKQQEATLTYAKTIQQLCDDDVIHGKKCGDAEEVVEKDGDVTGGLIGPQGPKGDTGEPGATGSQGPKGDTGSPGPSGKNGQDGQNGTPGDDGSPGSNGLPGSPGPQGPQGIQGEPGRDGTDGSPGPAGPQGPPGPTGVVAIQTIGCDGPVISYITSSYNAETRTITISCIQGEDS